MSSKFSFFEFVPFAESWIKKVVTLGLTPKRFLLSINDLTCKLIISVLVYKSGSPMNRHWLSLIMTLAVIGLRVLWIILCVRLRHYRNIIDQTSRFLMLKFDCWGVTNSIVRHKKHDHLIQQKSSILKTYDNLLFGELLLSTLEPSKKILDMPFFTFFCDLFDPEFVLIVMENLHLLNL